MHFLKSITLSSCLIVFITATSFAHFGMVIPSDSMVSQYENRKISLKLSFSHPFEAVGMNLAKPELFQVMHSGKISNLQNNLISTKVFNHQAWQVNYPITRPGTYAFYMKPKPYWEPAEDCFIVHHTKTMIAAFGDDAGWDKEWGLETEIVPLSRPFGLYAGNIFQGIVKLNGKAVPHAKVEVELFNENKRIQAPADLMITQTIKADTNGIFSYAVPAAGWWGFSALNTANYQLTFNKEKKDVELGAVLWVKFHKFPVQQ